MAARDGREVSAEEMFAAFKQDVADSAENRRWAHTHGLGVIGHFVPSDVARNFSKAEHFRGGSVAVTVRFSNSSSEEQRHDEWRDVRGMAVKFHLAEEECDLIAISLRVFITDTREEFLEVAAANRPRRVRREGTLAKLLDELRLRSPLPEPNPGQTVNGERGLLAYAGRNSEALSGVVAAGLMSVPQSWARVAYHAVHTFVVVDRDDVRRHVRFSWQPVEGVCAHGTPLPTDPAFLSAELRQRLAPGSSPARFQLKMTIGDDGDAFADCTTPWPVNRRVVTMGTLFLDRVADDQEAQCERLRFNPMRLVEGIEPSDDEILHARGEIYEIAADERGAIACPIRVAQR